MAHCRGKGKEINCQQYAQLMEKLHLLFLTVFWKMYMSICSDMKYGGRMNSDRCVSRIVHQEKVDLAKSQDLDPGKVEKLCQLFKAFSEPGRLRILHALLHQEMCVCDLAAMLEVSESAVSHQLRLLRTMGLVVNRRDGTVLYYRPANIRLIELIDFAGSLLESPKK